MSIPQAFMYPKTARALLNLARCRHIVRLARREGNEALRNGDFLMVRGLLELEQKANQSARELMIELLRGDHASH